MLALTATADTTTQEVICKTLVMKNPKRILVTPHRENLRFSVCKYSKQDIHQGLDWLVDLTKEYGKETPKTIIFCNTISEVSSVVNWLLFKLEKHAYSPTTSNNKEDLLIGIYHSMSWKSNKESIMKSLITNGSKRIIVATTALSMGVNFPDIKYILNWGPARTLLDQHQEAGRAGRDGKQAHVIINYFGQQLALCEDDVKNFVKSTECLRVAAYKPFDSNIKSLDVAHNCCSNCAMNCNCGNCDVFAHEQERDTRPASPSATRHVTDDDKECVREAFLEIRRSIPQSCSALGETSSHGFSLELIDSIVEHCDKLFNIHDINNFLPVFSTKHGLKILEVLDEIFSDIPQSSFAMDTLDPSMEQEQTIGARLFEDLQVETAEEFESFIYDEQLHSLTNFLGISDNESQDSEMDNSD